MPVKLFYLENGGILAKCKGIVTGSEIKEINDELYETEEKIRKILYQIVDFTTVEKLLVSNDEIDMISLQDKKAFEINPGMLIAVVTDQDLIFGLARMWEAKTYDPSFDTRVFRKLEDAREWVNSKLHEPQH
ncbi:MAG: hypothetical protein P8012_00945 [Desulfobacterales bacterium]